MGWVKEEEADRKDYWLIDKERKKRIKEEGKRKAGMGRGGERKIWKKENEENERQ